MLIALLQDNVLPAATNSTATFSPAAITTYSPTAIVGITVLLTCIIALIEITSSSKSPLRSCLTPEWGIYASILATGNIIGALFTPTVIEGKLPTSLISFSPFIFAFIGVFAFEGVLSNTNITVFGEGVLTIQAWIAKARLPAIVAANLAALRAEKDLAQVRANKLIKLPIDVLHVYVGRYLGQTTVDEINLSSASSPGTANLRLALALAELRPEDARAIIKSNHL